MTGGRGGSKADRRSAAQHQSADGREDFAILTSMGTLNQYRLVPALEADRVWLGELRHSVYQELFKVTFGGWDEARHIRHSKECWEGAHISIIWLDDVPTRRCPYWNDSTLRRRGLRRNRRGAASSTSPRSDK